MNPVKKNIMDKFYKINANEVVDSLGSSLTFGLSTKEIANRLRKFGKNRIETHKTKTYFHIFIEQLTSPFMWVLMAATLVVIFLKDYVDAAIIGFVILLNTVIGTIQEGKAENLLASLQTFLKSKTRVLRAGKIVTIDGAEIVPGDIIMLKGGDKIVADMRVITSNNLKVDEASMTGESELVKKTSGPIFEENLPIADQKNILFKGTHVISGFAKAVVVATGSNTSIGRMSTELEEIDINDIPLKRIISRLTKNLLIIIGAAIIIIFFIGILRGFEIQEMFLVVVALAVSAIPESLPIILTIVLATGVWRMGKRNALVKRLQAVQALGQATVLAVDKTGTITKNEMVVQTLYTDGKIYKIDGDGYQINGEVCDQNGELCLEDLKKDPILDLVGNICALSTFAHFEEDDDGKRKLVAGDPTEAALKVLGQKLGYIQEDLEDKYEKIAEIPFDASYAFHTGSYDVNGREMTFVSGSPEKLLTRTNRIWRNGEIEEISEKQIIEISQKMRESTDRGERMLALAYIDSADSNSGPEEIQNLIYVGFVGISDAIRKEAYGAVENAIKAGVRVVMITGDHKDTAKAIAKKVGIYKEGHTIITGKELQELSDQELYDKFANVSVFARVAPHDKMRIITLFKRRGEIVAMTGDGINDALSLAAADLGVSMGSVGTEIAKEASDIVLLDDNFDNITRAILEGRSIYQSIQRTTFYLLSTSVSEVLLIALAVFLGLPLPILASQIIWLNLVSDSFLIAAIALEPKDESDLIHERTPVNASLLDRLMMWRIFYIGLVMAIGTFFYFIYTQDVSAIKATTVALTTLTAYQIFNVFNARSRNDSAFSYKKIGKNYFVEISIIIVVLMQIFAVYNPFMQSILKTQPLALNDWIIIGLIGTTIVFFEEIIKFLRRRSAFGK